MQSSAPINTMIYYDNNSTRNLFANVKLRIYPKCPKISTIHAIFTLSFTRKQCLPRSSPLACGLPKLLPRILEERSKNRIKGIYYCLPHHPDLNRGGAIIISSILFPLLSHRANWQILLCFVAPSIQLQIISTCFPPP